MRASVLSVLWVVAACSSGDGGGGGAGGGSGGGSAGGGGGGGSNLPVASIDLTVGSVMLTTGQELVIGAQAKDAAGVAIPSAVFTWSSSDAAVASVVDGTVTTKTGGIANITASSGGVTSAIAKLIVVAVAPGAASSDTLIATALTAGTLSDELALTYRVYAAFNDPRLPPEYKGNDDRPETDVLEVLFERFDTLTVPTQNLLKRYLLRPSNKGSWLDPANAGKHRKDRPACDGDAPGWVPFMGTHASVWYDSRIPGELTKAQLISQAIETKVWPTLIDSEGFNPPRDDDSVFGCYGGDKRLDVYLVSPAGMGPNKGLTQPEGVFSTQAATYIMIRDTLPDSELRAAAAHEVMHAIQWSYKTVSSQSSYGWMRDATANWAIDNVYGKSPEAGQLEHSYADCYLTSPRLSLDDRSTGYCTAMGLGGAGRDYGAYLFFQFLEKTSSYTTVKAAIVGTTTSATSLEAVDLAISGGFKDQWPKFAKATWNKPPNDTKPASFKVWDDLTQSVKSEEVAGDLGGAVEVKTPLFPADLNNLSFKVMHFTFADPMTRSLLFYNGFFDQIQAGKKITVQAMWKDANDNWVEEDDWSTYEFIGLCRDIKLQRAKELVIIIANAEKTPGGKVTATAAPYLKRNDVGCWKYSGTVGMVEKAPSWNGTGRTANVNLVFQILAQAEGLQAKHPGFPNTLRAGLTLAIQPTGTDYSFAESYSTGCSFSFGPATFPVPMGATGFLMMNPFPELKNTDATANTFIHGTPTGTYTATLLDNRFITVNVSGTGCGPTAMDVVGGLLLTNSASGGMYINPPVALPNGDLVKSFTSSNATFTWSLQPQTQP